MGTIVRDYRPGDEAAAYFVCLKTGNHGDDGEAFYREDPDALGRLFVGPYLRFEPGLALVLEDDEGICGYALGALDSRSYYERYEREWRPGLCAQFPAPAGDPSSWTRVQSIHYLYHHPDYFCPAPYDIYPAHLHIDLISRVHRQGHGKRMMNELMDRLQAKGAPGVHLGMAASNDRAYRFYTTLGFVELCRRGNGDDETIYMGKRL
ncbi:MAG: GNAT family N-acetyltransferase [Planctomycetes bacterium]|nr:GNAT family N-acetyltransferase [Planctomycetota bacterium]